MKISEAIKTTAQEWKTSLHWSKIKWIPKGLWLIFPTISALIVAHFVPTVLEANISCAIGWIILFPWMWFWLDVFGKMNRETG